MCEFFGRIFDFDSLREIRLVDRQICLASTQVLQEYDEPVWGPDLTMEDPYCMSDVDFDGRVLPSMPGRTLRFPAEEYKRGSILELIPETSNGDVALLFRRASFLYDRSGLARTSRKSWEVSAGGPRNRPLIQPLKESLTHIMILSGSGSPHGCGSSILFIFAWRSKIHINFPRIL
jgi:hypothetical protein